MLKKKKKKKKKIIYEYALMRHSAFKVNYKGA